MASMVVFLSTKSLSLPSCAWKLGRTWCCIPTYVLGVLGVFIYLGGAREVGTTSEMCKTRLQLYVSSNANFEGVARP